MRVLENILKPIKLKDYVKRTALEADFTDLVRDETLVLQDGRPILYYNRLAWDFARIRDVLHGIEYQVSERTGGLKTISRVFGFQPRIALRRDFCTATSLASEAPDKNRAITDLGRQISDVYARHFPQVAADHAQQLNKIRPEWKMEGTVFTSGIINKNNPLKYHFDSGNFENVCSCMLGFKRDIQGGYLSLPELRLGLEIADGSLTIFDGQSLLHGVTPIHRVTPKAYRYTIVYYALKAMWQCGALTDEVARIRAVKTEREFKRAGLSQRVHPKVGKEIYVDQNGQTHGNEEE